MSCASESEKTLDSHDMPRPSIMTEITASQRRLKRKISWRKDPSLPRTEKETGFYTVSHSASIIPAFCHSFSIAWRCLSCTHSDRSTSAHRSHAHKCPIPPQIPAARPFPCLQFRAVPGERTSWGQSSSRLRYSLVHSGHELGEMIQNIVSSTHDVALYIYLDCRSVSHAHQHQHERHSRQTQLKPRRILFLTIYPHPGDRIYVIELMALGRIGLEECQELSLEQLQAGVAARKTTKTGNDFVGINGRQGLTQLNLGRLPSLRTLLESPAITKVMFDSRSAVAKLREACGVVTRGV